MGVDALVVTTACNELVIGLLVMFVGAGTFKIGLIVDCRRKVGVGV